MKRLLAIVALLITFSVIHVKAQTNKGHFVFGTDLVSYNSGHVQIKDYQAGRIKDTIKEGFTQWRGAFNIWAGYFVSDKVCVGLKFNGGAVFGNYYYPYYGYAPGPYEAPLGLFFRYYALRADSGKPFDIFFEGIASANYISTTDPEIPPYTKDPLTQLVIAGDAGVVFSANVSKRFAVQLKVGFTYNYYEYSVSGTFNGTDKTTMNVEVLQGQLRLQYKL